MANNTKTSKSAFIRTLKIDASKIEIDHTPTYWTSGDVTATITWNDTTYIHQYSKNNVDWVTVTGDSTDVVFGSNGILYARYSDGVAHSDPVEHKIEEKKDKVSHLKNNDYKISYKDEEYVTKNSQNNDSTINKRNIISIKNNNNEKSALDIESKLNDISNKEWEEIKTMAMRLKRILMLELVLTIYLKMV